MAIGFVKIFRSLMEHPIWLKKPFSQGQAWVDMIMMANHEGKEFMFGNELMKVERGSFITSELKLMDRWGWSKSKVRAFVLFLEHQNMLTRKTDHKKTALTLTNYCVIQDRKTINKPQKDYEKTSKEPVKDTNKNDKNVKNDKKVLNTYSDSFELDTAINDFLEMRKLIKAPMTSRAIKNMLIELDKLDKTVEGKIAILNQSITHSWKGVFPLKTNQVQPDKSGNIFFNMAKERNET